MAASSRLDGSTRLQRWRRTEMRAASSSVRSSRAWSNHLARLGVEPAARSTCPQTSAARGDSERFAVEDRFSVRRESARAVP